MDNEYQLLIRIAVAGVLAGVVGYEREAAGKSAGLRTHMLVGMSAAFFVGLGELSVAEFARDPHVPADQALQYDPIRVIQSVVIGIGFLGSGIVFVDREHTRARGLTTAASIWATAGLGMACGLGLYGLAGGAALLFLLVLRVLVRFDGGDG